MTRLDPDRLVAELKRGGLTVVGSDGWRTRTAGGTPDVHIIAIHDSVTGAMTDAAAVAFCIRGRSDVPGPLYNLMVGKDGTIHLLALLRSNNIGSTNKARIDLARASRMPEDRELGAPSPDNYSAGNSVSFGISFITSGAGPYTDAQYRAGVKAAAAVGRALGWAVTDAVRSLIGHQEATRRKSDPQFDMGKFRRDVRAAFSPVLTSEESVTMETLTGKLPLLRHSYRDPVAGGNYVGRMQTLLRLFDYDITVDGVYDGATATAVKAFYAKYLQRTVTGLNFDDAGWHRLYGLQN